MDLNIYLRLTEEFNRGRPRAVLAGGQAVVLHRLAIMSKDGDWILREDAEALGHVLGVLQAHGARYRFGAPLALSWMTGGWSAHFEFSTDGLRVRTDFVTRPPRLAAAALQGIWRRQDATSPPAQEAKLGPVDLIRTKQTNREKDYAAIGELARLLEDPSLGMLYSRSARDILAIHAAHPGLAGKLVPDRPLLAAVVAGREALEAALDAERRQMMKSNELRLQRYADASRDWAETWPAVEREIAGLPLPEAHEIVVARATKCLPSAVTGT